MAATARPKKDLTQGPIFSHMWKMALPMMIGLMAHMLLNLVDGMYVANLGTEEAMAVLNYGFPIFYIPFALFNGLSTGTAAILAQYVGAKNIKGANNLLSQIIFVALGVYGVLLLFSPVLINGYFHWLKVPPSTGSLTITYLIPALAALFFTCLSLLLGAGLRAEGDMKALMKAMMYGTLINIILDPLFIFNSFSIFGITIPGFGWGVRGAAWATFAAAVFTFLIIARSFFTKKNELQWPVKPNWSDKDGLIKTIKVGSPAVVSQMMLAFMTTAVTFLATPFGLTAVAAMGIGARLDIIAVFPALSITTAVISLVGQNFGAGNRERVVQSIRTGLITAFVTLVTIGSTVFLFKKGLVGFFSPEAEVERSAIHYVSCISLSYGFIGIAMVCGGAFQGMGKGLPGMFITVFRLFLLNFAIGFLLSRFTGLGEWGIHYAPLITNITMGIVAVLWLRMELNKLKAGTQ